MNLNAFSLRRLLPITIAVLAVFFGFFYFFHLKSSGAQSGFADTQAGSVGPKPQAAATSKPVTSSTYKGAITAWLKNQYRAHNVSHIGILYTKWIAPAYLSQVSFDVKGTRYLAATFVDRHGAQWTFDPIQADLPVDPNKPLQVVTASGSLPHDTAGYVFVSGRVKPSVQYVVLHFLSGTVVQVYVSPLHTFAYLLPHSQKGLSAIDAYTSSHGLMARQSW